VKYCPKHYKRFEEVVEVGRREESMMKDEARTWGCSYWK